MSRQTSLPFSCAETVPKKIRAPKNSILEVAAEAAKRGGVAKCPLSEFMWPESSFWGVKSVKLR